MLDFSGFFNQFGFYILTGFLAVDILLAVWIFYARMNFKKIFTGENADLERVLLEMRKNEVVFAEALKGLAERVGVAEKELSKDLRKIGLVRYNPFSDAGGDQSFALALLDDKKNGVVLSSLYGREMNRVYAKQIEKGASKYSLTEEEKTAIQNAK